MSIAFEILFKQNFPFWDKIAEHEQQTLIQHAVELNYSKGSNIHSGENDCVGLILVKSGVLRTYMLSEEGKEITLYRLYPGDICILSASCVLNSITFEVFIDAEIDSDIILVRSPAYLDLMNKNIYVQNFSYKLATERFSDVMWAMQQILFMSFDKRLAVFLLDEVSTSGSTKIKLTHEQIAKYMGSAREVVSRMLKHFNNEGIVKLSRGGIEILDKDKLRKII